MKKLICKIFGHKWLYGMSGEKTCLKFPFDFKYSEYQYCRRCNKKEPLTDKKIIEHFENREREFREMIENDAKLHSAIKGLFNNK